MNRGMLVRALLSSIHLNLNYKEKRFDRTSTTGNNAYPLEVVHVMYLLHGKSIINLKDQIIIQGTFA